MTILVIITVVILASGTVFWYRRRTRRILENLNRMLDIAMQGDFTEKHFDESMLSSVETKLAHYLAASSTSAKNVQAEKDKIKTLPTFPTKRKCLLQTFFSTHSFCGNSRCQRRASPVWLLWKASQESCKA